MLIFADMDKMQLYKRLILSAATIAATLLLCVDAFAVFAKNANFRDSIPFEIKSNKCIDQNSIQKSATGELTYNLVPPPHTKDKCFVTLNNSCDPKTGIYEIVPINPPQDLLKNRCVDQQSLTCVGGEFLYDFMPLDYGYEMKNDKCVPLKCENGEAPIKAECQVSEDNQIVCNNSSGDEMERISDFLGTLGEIATNDFVIYLAVDLHIVKINMRDKNRDIEYLTNDELPGHPQKIAVNKDDHLILKFDEVSYRLSSTGDLEPQSETTSGEKDFSNAKTWFFVCPTNH